MKIGDKVYAVSLEATDRRQGLTEEMEESFKNENTMEVVSIDNYDNTIECLLQCGEYFVYEKGDISIKYRKVNYKNVLKYLQEDLLKELSIFEVRTLEPVMEFEKSHLKVGCQEISKKDALKIADKIYQAYGE